MSGKSVEKTEEITEKEYIIIENCWAQEPSESYTIDTVLVKLDDIYNNEYCSYTSIILL